MIPNSSSLWILYTYPSTIYNVPFPSAVKFPKQYVEEARQKGFNKTTAGDTIATHYNSQGKNIVNSKDPHSFLTSKASPRVALLKQAVATTLGQLLFEIGYE